MSNTSYISKFNIELVKSVKIKAKLKLWIIFSVIITILLLFYLNSTIVFVYFLFSSFIIKEFYLSKPIPNKFLNGYIGEKNCLKILKKLPNDFIIFNQIEIPSSKSSFDEFETDFIVVGKNTIFIVECKSYHGHVICKEKDSDWLKKEYDFKGNIRNTFVIKSPFKQIDRQRKYFLLFMEKLGLEVKVHTALFLNMHKKDINIPEFPEIPVFTDKNIVKHIKTIDNTEHTFKTVNERLNTINILISINKESIESRKSRLHNKRYLQTYFDENSGKKTLMDKKAFSN